MSEFDVTDVLGNVADTLGTAVKRSVDPLGVTERAITGFRDVSSEPDPAQNTGPPPPSQGEIALSNLQAQQPAQNFGGLDARRPKMGGSSSIEVERTITPPVPQELQNRAVKIAESRADLESAYQTERASQLGIIFDAAVEFEHGWRNSFEETRATIDQLLTEAEEEKQGIADLIEAAESNRINPGQFFANVDGAGRFAAALAVGVGAMASAFGGGPNMAYDIISKAIDRNVRAQVVNQQHGRALIAHQTNFVNAIRGLVNDQHQYGNYIRLGLTAMAKAKMGAATTSLAQTRAQLAARDVYLRLGAALTEAQIKAITNSAARVTYKLKNAAQIDQALGFRTAARPALATGARSKRAPDDALRGALDAAANAYAQGRSPEEAVQQAAASMSAARGGKPSSQDAQQLVQAFQQLAQGAPDDMQRQRMQPLANAASQLAVKDFVAADTTIPLGVGQNIGVYVTNPQLYKKNFDPGELSRAAQNISDIVRLKQLMNQGGNIPPDMPILRDVYIGADGDAKLSTFLNQSEAERQATINQISNRLIKAWHVQNSGNARNALSLEWERRFAEKGAGLNVSVWQFVADVMSSDPSIRVARLGSAEEDALSSYRQTAASMGVDTDLGL